MTLTPVRWMALLVVACAVVATTFLPLERAAREDSAYERARAKDPLHSWQLRSAARSRHLGELLLQSRANEDLLLAKSAFSARAGRVGDPELVFAANVSAVTRENVQRMIAAEQDQHGVWRGKGKVGVIVARDSDLVAPAAAPPSSEFRFLRWALRKRVIAPSAITGERCVVIVRYRSGWLDKPGAKANASYPLLDACGFYDAFGAPGAGIAHDLRAVRFERARVYNTPRTTDAAPFRFSYTGSARTLSVPYDVLGSLACRGGRDSACLALTAALPAGRTDTFYERREAVENIPDNVSSELAWRFSYDAELYSGLAHDLGAARFATLWHSGKSLREAYQDASGESLAQWVRRREERNLGTYRAGPWAPAWSASLTLLAIAAMLGAALRFARRPGAA